MVHPNIVGISRVNKFFMWESSGLPLCREVRADLSTRVQVFTSEKTQHLIFEYPLILMMPVSRLHIE
jgi:hypothetical protein